MKDSDKIQAVINTLDEIMIPGTYDNVNRMLGIHQTLRDVMMGLRQAESAAEEPARKEGSQDGTGDGIPG